MKMNIRSVLLVTGLVLTAPVVASAEEDQAAKAAKTAQFARGARAWQENCGRCHNLRAPNEKQDYEWDLSVNHMRVIANLPGETAEAIKVFLKASN